MTEPARKDLDSAAWADPQSLVRAGATATPRSACTTW